MKNKYEKRIAKLASKCPGFVGGDPPKEPGSKGRVIVEPGRVSEAVPWLRRRFYVSEDIALSIDVGLCIEIASRRARGSTGGKRLPVTFGRPVQFQLNFETGEAGSIQAVRVLSPVVVPPSLTNP